MGAATIQQTMTASTPTPPTSKPVRPSLVNKSNGNGGRGFSYRSKSGHGISYRSKSGRTLTFEFTPSSGTTTHNPKHKPHENFPNLTALTPAKVTAKAKDLSLPQKTDLVVTSSASANANAPDANAGMLVGIYESISFWCMEAVEVACWGPYDEDPGK